MHKTSHKVDTSPEQARQGYSNVCSLVDTYMAVTACECTVSRAGYNIDDSYQYCFYAKYPDTTVLWRPVNNEI